MPQRECSRTLKTDWEAEQSRDWDNRYHTQRCHLIFSLSCWTLLNAPTLSMNNTIIILLTVINFVQCQIIVIKRCWTCLMGVSYCSQAVEVTVDVSPWQPSFPSCSTLLLFPLSTTSLLTRSRCALLAEGSLSDASATVSAAGCRGIQRKYPSNISPRTTILIWEGCQEDHSRITMPLTIILNPSCSLPCTSTDRWMLSAVAL